METIRKLPIRTRLPGVAWAIDGLVTLFSVSSSFYFNVAPHPTAHIAQQAPNPTKQTRQANVIELLEMFRAF